MSVEAKQLLMKEIESVLSTKMTSAMMIEALGEIESKIVEYTVDRDESQCDQHVFDELLDSFIEAKTIEGRSVKTMERYRYILGRLRDESNIPINRMTVFTMRSWLSKEQSRGISDITLEGYRNIFSSFFGWLHKEGLLQNNPCANLGPIKCRKQVKTPYSDIEIEMLKEACTCSRDKALVQFLLSTGCRISEVCALDRDSLDFHEMEVKVLGKGDKERTVFFDDVTAMLLKRYFAERKDDSPALFAGKGTGRMTPGGVRAKLNKIADRAGVENVFPHKFRRTLATTLIDRGMSIQEVASILGHDKLDTTMKYVFLNKTNVKNHYHKYS